MGARRVKKPKVAATASALDQLVSQFAQPLAFLRELVQNSLDASTELIEVEVDFDDEANCCFVRVRDTGIGMDRNVIDTKLTRLFASSKENDLTKIGKFGIGFVSIFAIKPELVVLETGRDGESWRLLFKPDRSFERRELPHPVEGTSVTVYVPKKRRDLEELKTDCRETVAFWCRHSEVEILFNGEPINEPFDLREAAFRWRREIEGTEAVVAPSLNPKGFHGYYNRGLTLLEGDGSPLPHVSFKLRSRYLEHTLSRDNIIYDEGYEKALAEVKVAAYQEMPEALLQELARRGDERLWALARTLFEHPDRGAGAFSRVAIFPTQAGLLRLNQIEERVYVHPEVDDFWRGAEAGGLQVLRGRASDEMCWLLKDSGRTVCDLASVILNFQPIVPASEDEQGLLAELAQLNPVWKRLKLIEAINCPKIWEGRLCGYLPVDGGVAGSPVLRSPTPSQPIGLFPSHPLWQQALILHAVQPELALTLVVRKLSLELRWGTDMDGKLLGRLIKTLRERTEA